MVVALQRALVLVLVLLYASPAAAQRVDRSGVPYRPWDLHGAIGFNSADGSDGSLGGLSRNEWEPSWTLSLDVGRYWSSHLKTEAGLMWLSDVDYYASEAITSPGGQTIGQSFSTIETRRTQLVVAGTYQFLENVFAHPYVSAGARVGLLDEHTTTTRYLYANQGPTIITSPVETRGRTVSVRPFAAVGSKSYFSERVFIRPEMLVAVGADGISQFGLRLGVGIDF